MKDAECTTEMLDAGIEELKKMLPMTREMQEETVIEIYNAMRRKDPTVPKEPTQ